MLIADGWRDSQVDLLTRERRFRLRDVDATRAFDDVIYGGGRPKMGSPVKHKISLELKPGLLFAPLQDGIITGFNSMEDAHDACLSCSSWEETKRKLWPERICKAESRSKLDGLLRACMTQRGSRMVVR